MKKSSAPNLQELDADTDSNGSGGGGGFTKNFTRNNWGSSKRFSRIVSFYLVFRDQEFFNHEMS